MQFLVLIGPNHLGLTHLLILKPDTEARGMGWLAWPGLDQGSSLKLGWGISSIEVYGIWYQCVCVYAHACMCMLGVVWGAWMLLNQKYSPLSSSVELHTSPWDWTPVGHDYLPTLPTLGLSVMLALLKRWGPPSSLEVFPRLCLACLQLVLFLLQMFPASCTVHVMSFQTLWQLVSHVHKEPFKAECG